MGWNQQRLLKITGSTRESTPPKKKQLNVAQIKTGNRVGTKSKGYSFAA